MLYIKQIFNMMFISIENGILLFSAIPFLCVLIYSINRSIQRSKKAITEENKNSDCVEKIKRGRECSKDPEYNSSGMVVHAS